MIYAHIPPEHLPDVVNKLNVKQASDNQQPTGRKKGPLGDPSQRAELLVLQWIVNAKKESTVAVDLNLGVE